MSLTPDSIKRTTDASGDDILTFETSESKQVQAVATVDDAGAQELSFGTNAVDEASSTVTYVGKETPGGQWMLMKIDTSSGTVITYATITNNPLVATYAAAWAARNMTLVYGTYSEAL